MYWSCRHSHSLSSPAQPAHNLADALPEGSGGSQLVLVAQRMDTHVMGQDCRAAEQACIDEVSHECARALPTHRCISGDQHVWAIGREH